VDTAVVEVVSVAAMAEVAGILVAIMVAMEGVALAEVFMVSAWVTV
jgi:hypothetical protein